MKIGSLIEKKAREMGISVTQLAQKLETGRSNVYHIFTRDSIDTEMLSKVSEALEYDFFQLFLQKDTLERLKMTHNVKMTKVIVELELTDEEMEEYKLFNRVINELQDNYSNNIVAEKNINYGNSTNE